jgi:copper chaperone CopZ
MYKTTIKVDGMMCGMCEAHVNDALRNAFPEAKKVKSSHTKGETVLLSEAAPNEDKVKETIEKTGYTFVSLNSQVYVKKLFGLF